MCKARVTMKGFVLTNSSEHNHPSSRDQLTAENIERKWINAATSSISNRELTAEIEVECVFYNPPPPSKMCIS